MKWFLKASAGLAAAALLAQTVTTGEKLYVKTRAIGEKLKCQCSCNYSVGSCNMLNCPFREEVNAEVRPMLESGLDDRAILAKLREKFGTVILAAPPAEGFNLLGWIMPLAALGIGLLIVRGLLVRWRRPRPAPAVPGAVVARFRDQMEKELSELE